MASVHVKQALEILARFIPEARKARLKSIAQKRSTHVALLLENIVDFGNHNAALRTMEALGLQSVHTVGVKNKITNRTDAGSKQWLSIRDWNTTAECVKILREQGYRIVSSSLNAHKTLHDIQPDQKTVVAFGNEHNGISQELEDLSDYTFLLPMWGFVQSYNISVAVAITMFHCRSSIENVDRMTTLCVTE